MKVTIPLTARRCWKPPRDCSTIVEATRREQRRLKDEARTGERVGKVIGRYKTARRCSRDIDERVRAHVLLCMLACYVEWHMRRRLAPLLFDEEDRAGAEAARAGVVMNR